MAANGGAASATTEAFRKNNGVRSAVRWRKKTARAEITLAITSPRPKWALASY